MSEIQECKECGVKISGSFYRMADGKTEKFVKTICGACERGKDPSRKYDNEKRMLPDGIYDVTGLEIMYFRDIGWYEPAKLEAQEGVKEFMEKHPDYVIAHAYQTEYIYIIERRPEEFSSKVQVAGGSFNYGACNLLTQLPDSILILAEDD